MCVTADPAYIEGTRTYVHATTLEGEPVHVCGYQNKAESVLGGNCMFLNYAGTDLRLVRGPERTRHLMEDMTASLKELVPIPRSRGMSFGYETRGFSVEEYGDYTVILAQEAGDILSVLDQVPEHRRPARSSRLQHMVDFYMSWYERDSFVLACFDGTAEPKHPITVSYRPRDAELLTIPGLDGHDGQVPTVGAPVRRDFHVAFSAEGLELPHKVYYNDPGVAGKPWAPSSVAGFFDNRRDGLNGDYVVPLDALHQRLTGWDLVATLL